MFDQLDGLIFDSLIDIGCGDGRFLREASIRYSNARTLGIDHSVRAIELARAMNPELDFIPLNIIGKPPLDAFDVATMIEVLEHVPPDSLHSFLEGVSSSLGDGGKLVLTVPHINVPTQDKHYQHFSSRELRQILERHFGDIRILFFDRHSRILAILRRLIGGQGKHFVVTNRRLTSWFYRLYVRRFLYTDDEGRCGRIAAICQGW